MVFYVGVDLHSNNNYIGIIDEKGREVFKKKNPNDTIEILKTLIPFKETIKGVVIESTFNWYWLVDCLMDCGYKVHLANPAAIQQYSGLKHSADNSDAMWLAEMLRLGILPEGYIYPKELRAVRDLLRKRLSLVHHRTSLLLSMKGMINNCLGENISPSELQKLNIEKIEGLFINPLQTKSASCFQEVVEVLNIQIKDIEQTVLKEVKLKPEFQKLITVNGIGKILGLTIMLETGEIGRFATSGDYSSYSRSVSSKRISNGKKKGSGNKKNGNRYLAWAYVEAAHFMVRYCELAKSWHQRKAAKKGHIVATKALSSKVAKACYYIMRDQVDFNPEKMFS